MILPFPGRQCRPYIIEPQHMPRAPAQSVYRLTVVMSERETQSPVPDPGGPAEMRHGG